MVRAGEEDVTQLNDSYYLANKLTCADRDKTLTPKISCSTCTPSKHFAYVFQSYPCRYAQKLIQYARTKIVQSSY